MRKNKIACLLLSVIMMMACVLGASAASVQPKENVPESYIPTQVWREEANLIENILQRDGYIEGIWFPWYKHEFLGHCLTGNDMYAKVLGDDSWMKVGIDQYGELNIYRELYNLKAFGYNIIGYEGSPLSEGVVYDDYGNVLGVKEDYLQNMRRLLNIFREVDIPVLWTLTMHSTVSSEYWEEGKRAWDITAQMYGNPKVADQYVENYITPVCKVLAEYPDVVAMVSVGIELENEINDSEIGNYFDHRYMYGVEQEPMLYLINAITETAKRELPNVSRVIGSTSNDLTIYEDTDLDFIGKNHYPGMPATAPGMAAHHTTAPMIVTEFGLGEGVMVTDEVWTIKQIQFRENFIEDGCAGWMQWCWQSEVDGGAFDLLKEGSTSKTDFRIGAYSVKYFVDNYRAAYRGEEIVLDTPVLFCNRGSGLVEWIASRQATELSLERSLDGGKTWKTLLDKVSPFEYEESFKGSYTDLEVENMNPDGTTCMYRVTVWDDEGNVRVSEPNNEAVIVGPPSNILAEQGLNYSFENGLEGWNEFGLNGTFEEGANYCAKVIDADGANGSKALDFKMNYGYDENGKVILAKEWNGITMDGITVKPNTQYELVVNFKIAPDALFEWEESTNDHKMSGYLFARGLGDDGSGSGLGDINDEALGQIWMLFGSKTEWRSESHIFKTNNSDKLCLDLRAVLFGNTPVHYLIDSIELYEIK